MEGICTCVILTILRLRVLPLHESGSGHREGAYVNEDWVKVQGEGAGDKETEAKGHAIVYLNKQRKPQGRLGSSSWSFLYLTTP